MRTITLILALLIAGCCKVEAQVKIGNITIDNETAQRYFADCYMHPDTLTREYVDGCGDEMEKEVKEYNNWLSYASIKHIVVEINHPASMDTITTGSLQFIEEMNNCPYGSIKHEKPYFEPKHTPVKGYKGHEKSFTIFPVAAYVERVEIGFAVPRKPTETDFIKWTIKNQISK